MLLTAPNEQSQAPRAGLAISISASKRTKKDKIKPGFKIFFIKLFINSERAEDEVDRGVTYKNYDHAKDRPDYGGLGIFYFLRAAAGSHPDKTAVDKNREGDRADYAQNSFDGVADKSARGNLADG